MCVLSNEERGVFRICAVVLYEAVRLISVFLSYLRCAELNRPLCFFSMEMMYACFNDDCAIGHYLPGIAQYAM